MESNDQENTPDQSVAEEPKKDAGKPAESPDSPESPAEKPARKKKILIVAGVVVLLGIAAAAYWYYGISKKPNDAAVVNKTTPVATPSATPLDKAAQILQNFGKPTTGETWLPTPKKLPSQNFFKAADDQGATYSQVGQRGTSKIVMSDILQVGEFVQLFEISATGKVTAILHPDGEAVYNADEDAQYESTFAAKVSVDTSTHYDSLTMPLSLPIGKGYSVQKPTSTGLGNVIDDSAKPDETVITKYGPSTLVREQTVYADTKLTSISYVMLTPIHTRIGLNFTPLEINLSGYQWSAGSSTDDTISPITRGCGGAATAVSRSDVLTSADVKEAGKSPSGLTVYALTSVNNPLMTKAYQEFNDFYAGEDKSQNPNIGITKDQFAALHGIVILHDNFGQWLVYARDQLRPAGGCAKPVIYLYPTKAQQVNVHVGATVKNSDPAYSPITGWNVWANPNGSLNVAGSVYGSLFWDGVGFGQYPGITAGTVVPQAQAATVIRRQLAEQGLVGREIDDFMAYWQPRLPKAPYIRLTWFNTSQMNTLAPLAISPSPTTLLRVFLDADGLSAPISLPAQHFTAPARKGFTVVEWGGLAHTPLP